MFRGLVGSDGWCRHYDTEKRVCQIYDDRPSFCRVKTWLATKAEGFGIDASNEAELSGFCTDCCREHVTTVYGESSEEMVRFEAEVNGAGGVLLQASDAVPGGWEAEEEWGLDVDEDDTEGESAEDGEDEWDEAEEWDRLEEEEEDKEDADRL